MYTIFCILILYPEILLNTFTSSNIFGGKFGLFIYANSDSFISPFQSGFHFYLFSCILGVVQTSNTISNKNGEDGHPCLISHLRGIAFSFHNQILC